MAKAQFEFRVKSAISQHFHDWKYADAESVEEGWQFVFGETLSIVTHSPLSIRFKRKPGWFREGDEYDYIEMVTYAIEATDHAEGFDPVLYGEVETILTYRSEAKKNKSSRWGMLLD